MSDSSTDSATLGQSDNEQSQLLADIAKRPPLARAVGYVRLSGPGWLQGAMTLGGGSAIASLTIGGVYGYELLWVQPLAMLIGCIMLFALSHQTLTTGERPFKAMSRIHPALAWGWALAALASSIIWGFSHYPLSAGMAEEVVTVTTGFQLDDGNARELYLFALAIIVWAFCAYTAWHYGKGGSTVRLFENGIKWLSILTVLAFAFVVVTASWNGQVDWLRVLHGFVPGNLPTDSDGVMTIMAALGAAVGINMTFVYGYTLLNRGWGKAQRELSRYDIIMGLVLPYVLVTSLISIAAAGALSSIDTDISGKLSPAMASQIFVQAGLGEVPARLIFSLGILGMAVGSLVMHMLTCGFAASEMFGWPTNSLRYRLALLLPTPAVLGVFVWSSMGAYVVLPTSAICGVLLPIAYIGWLLLNNRRDYLGDDMPAGRKRTIYNAAMLLCILTVIASVLYTTSVKLGWL
ncbi:hypothetical protein QWI17_07200 [Gilvimarinus sp. SDUM040013]|uniref:Uncharacterized protein n=1 Tax=Gilvimarinus gilvus TaxID=3058038 RepID=A0ABU4S2A7_9GAMM|nr:hypothetical protein [Gilvimarinus sp. SDUM040013]MDO3385619.1 hypothetical protein [Gilvimarinus sp. SDUM040013]MDX6849953.1 hypothetical protein [Gilvimarinus sp. SDUM040013]